MDGWAWQATNHGVTRVGYNLATGSSSASYISFQLLKNQSLRTLHPKTNIHLLMLSHRFCSSGTWAQLGWLLQAQGLSWACSQGVSWPIWRASFQVHAHSQFAGGFSPSSCEPLPRAALCRVSTDQMERETERQKGRGRKERGSSRQRPWYIS